MKCTMANGSRFRSGADFSGTMHAMEARDGSFQPTMKTSTFEKSAKAPSGERTTNRTLLLTAGILLIGSISAGAAEPSEAVQQVWRKDCAKCHGLTGHADTKAGKKIGAIDFTDPKNQEKFTDDQMIKTIKEGVKDEKGKIKMKPAENLNDDQIKEMLAFIRAFKK